MDPVELLENPVELLQNPVEFSQNPVELLENPVESKFIFVYFFMARAQSPVLKKKRCKIHGHFTIYGTSMQKLVAKNRPSSKIVLKGE